MSTIYELDRFNYLVQQPPYDWLLSFVEQGPQVCVTLSTVVDYDPMFETFCLGFEVWATSLLSYRPLHVLVNEVAQLIYTAEEIRYPVELVSIFGGRLLGDTLPLKAIGRLH